MGHEQPLITSYLEVVEKLSAVVKYAQSLEDTHQHMYGTKSSIAEELFNIIGLGKEDEV